MSTEQIQEWHSRVLTPFEIKGKSVIEIGSWNGNGSIRDYIEPHKPSFYVGIDIMQQERYVNVIANVNSLNIIYPEETFDIVISEEMLEHVYEWKKAIHNMKRLCKKGGILILCARSPGYPYHGMANWFGDYWRFTKEDFKYIFEDFQIDSLEYEEPEKGGIFLKAFKPFHYEEKNIENYVVSSDGMDKQQI